MGSVKAMSFCVAVSLALLGLLGNLVECTVLFSTLPRTLVVQAQIQGQSVSTGGLAVAGKDHLVIEWSLNSSTTAGVDAAYVNVKLKLCYAPVSQVDRAWRKTKDDLHKDKTCGVAIKTQKYTQSGNTTTWRIAKSVPGASYFVRAYAVNGNGTQLAFGQTTNKSKTTNLITIKPISGRTVPLDIAAAVFSAFSVGSLIAFLVAEKARSKTA